LIAKSEQAGIEITDIIGDTAYSEKENISCAKASGLFGMQIREATTIFAVNLKKGL
jgi:hypothetical protein